MELMVERVDVWAAPIADEPGGMARVLDELRVAGADLDFIIARRDHKTGGAVLFLTPLRGDKEIDAAAELGFNITASVNSLRVEGQNQQGMAAIIAGKMAEAGINLHGFSAAVQGPRFVAYIGFDSCEDADRAKKILLQD